MFLCRRLCSVLQNINRAKEKSAKLKIVQKGSRAIGEKGQIENIARCDRAKG